MNLNMYAKFSKGYMMSHIYSQRNTSHDIFDDKSQDLIKYDLFNNENLFVSNVEIDCY